MSESDEKPHEPSQKKLLDARKKGEIVRSQELNLSILYLSLFSTLYFLGQNIFEDVFVSLKAFFDLAIGSSIANAYQPRDKAIFDISNEIIVATIPVIGGGLAALVLSFFAQNSLIFVGSNIYLKLDRISPLAGAKKKFGSNGFFEFLKSAIKLGIYSFILIAFLYKSLDDMVLLSQIEPRVGISALLTKCSFLLSLALIVSISLTFIDYIWQRSQFLKKNRMSQQEVKDEFRDSEGDPQFKGVRRQRAIEIASNGMMRDVPGADVVVVNPTHVAVALKWDRNSHSAPILIAKGYDEIALRIRMIATENDVPIFEDIHAAWQLCGDLNIGDEIHTTHYEAVASAIRFAQRAQSKWSLS